MEIESRICDMCGSVDVQHGPDKQCIEWTPNHWSKTSKPQPHWRFTAWRPEGRFGVSWDASLAAAKKFFKAGDSVASKTNEPECRCSTKDLASGPHPETCAWAVWKKGKR